MLQDRINQDATERQVSLKNAWDHATTTEKINFLRNTIADNYDPQDPTSYSIDLGKSEKGSIKFLGVTVNIEVVKDGQ